jgi:hypothetical protein
MRNVQDKKDIALSTAFGVGIALFAGITFANATAPAEAPVTPDTSVVHADISSNTSGGVFQTNVSGGKLAK